MENNYVGNGQQVIISIIPCEQLNMRCYRGGPSLNKPKQRCFSVWQMVQRRNTKHVSVTNDRFSQWFGKTVMPDLKMKVFMSCIGSLQIWVSRVVI